MAKPPKTPRPVKGPPLPPRENDSITPVGMQQERLIGRVVIAWTKLEGALDGLIWHLLGLEIEGGRIITARLDAVAKIKMSRDLGNLNLDEDQFHKLSPILDRVDILREHRNHIVHGLWALKWPRSFEQNFRVVKWIVGRGLCCHAERQRVRVGLIRGAAVKGCVRSPCVVEGDAAAD